MKAGWIGLILCSGILVTVQAAINAQLRTYVVNPFYSSLISFVVGTVALLVIALISNATGQTGNWRGATQAPSWLLIGGVLGAIYVTSAILAIPKIGAGSVATSLIVGQLLAALMLDHFGWIGLPRFELTGSRIFGAGLLILGLWFIQRK
ncbi:MAG TPA: DMT family transporter [Acidobacteriota bacterium]|nr:DMT family transporter [Acidobacteriota bacterium]HNJ43146.1 DMT family transporter [Acidobacteriota bacterium]